MTNSRPQVEIYSDGACIGNPGPGGYAAILISGARRKEISGGFRHTTNQRMELKAVIAALKELKQPSEVKVFTDSEYVRRGITSWLKDWLRRGWKTANKTPVKNRDLWEQLAAETERHSMQWQWVKGHSGNSDNERCDQLAQQAARGTALEVDTGYTA